MTAWLKTFRKGNLASVRQSPDDLGPVGEQRVFYEPLSTHSDGTPKLSQHGEPMGKPNYQIGELVAGYWNGTYEVGEVWEVIGEPEVSDQIGWGWQTEVELVGKRDPGMTLDELDINPKSLGRRVRLRLDDEQESRLRKGFGI
jgi:hypothetical protein